MKFDAPTTLVEAQSMAQKSLEYFKEEEKNYYDFMFTLKDLFPTSEELPEYFFMETIDNPLLNDDVIDEE